MTWDLTLAGTKSLLFGHLLGVAPVPKADLTTFSIFISTALMKTSGRRIVSDSSSMAFSKHRDNAPGLTFLVPDQYAKWKLNLEKNRAHLAWRE